MGVSIAMYLVTFRLRPGAYDDAFHERNDAIQALAESIDGYLGKRTWEDPDTDEVLVVYRWESLDALETFATAPEHRAAKARWSEWYDAYEVTVTEVVDTYGSGFDDDETATE